MAGQKACSAGGGKLERPERSEDERACGRRAVGHSVVTFPSAGAEGEVIGEPVAQDERAAPDLDSRKRSFVASAVGEQVAGAHSDAEVVGGLGDRHQLRVLVQGFRRWFHAPPVTPGSRRLGQMSRNLAENLGG